MAAVTVQMVHGLEPVRDAARIVGLGVCAGPMEQPNYKKPPMVVLVRDTESVLGDDGHDRNAPFDPYGEATSVVLIVCALDHDVAHELATLLSRLADRIERSDTYGSMQDEPRDFRVYLPAEMRWTTLRVAQHTIAGAGDSIVHAAGLVIEGVVIAILGNEACQLVATQIAIKARKVRQAMVPDALLPPTP